MLLNQLTIRTLLATGIICFGLWGVHTQHQDPSKTDDQQDFVDAYARGVTIWVFDTHGQLKKTQHTQKLTHHHQSGTYDATRFFGTVFQAGSEIWHASAQQAQANSHFDHVILKNTAKVYREATLTHPPIQIDTALLHYFPNSQLATSPTHSTITRPNSDLSGTGLRINFKTGQMEILKNLVAHNFFGPQHRPKP